MASGNSAFLQQWEELRKRARQLEADVDGKLIAYNRMSISQDSPLAAAAADTERDALLQNGDSVSASLAAELESLLLQLSETNDGMGRCVSDCQTGEGARMSNVLQRHRELLHEYEKEFRKIKANIKEQRERDDLLHSVRQDIGDGELANRFACARARSYTAQLANCGQNPQWSCNNLRCASQSEAVLQVKDLRGMPPA
eukprot:746706-Hanusia_phi.AAC.3